MRLHTRAWLRVVLIAGLVTVATGATFEQVARFRTRHAHTMPGILVNIGGGRRLQLDCRGAGSPTVVLESGLDAFGSLAWAAVHDSIAATTRVCAYSRAGIMWSDAADVPFDSRNVVRDLHAALSVAGEQTPWVMVGHSIGAAYVTTFVQQYGSEVDGVVFVDGSHPDQFARLEDVTGKMLAPSSTVARIGAALTWTGLVRALPAAPTPTTWPTVIATVTPTFLPTSLGALVDEMQAVPATLAHAGEVRAFGDRPLIVLAAGQTNEPAALAAMGVTPEQGQRMQAVFLALHEDQATWSRRGRNEVVQGATHYIQFDQPGVVTAAVREVVAAVRLTRVQR